MKKILFWELCLDMIELSNATGISSELSQHVYTIRNSTAMNKTINQTENGKIFRCPDCNKIHIEYKNLNFSLNDKEYESFVNYFKELDGQYWEKINSNVPYRRKIIVPIGHKNVNILLNNTELQELKKLFSKPLVMKQEMITHFKYNICDN